MLTPAMRAKIINGIESETDMQLVQEEQLVPGPIEPPFVTLSFHPEGVRQQGFLNVIRDYYDGENWTEWRGRMSRATVNLVVHGGSLTEVQERAHEIYEMLWRTEANVGTDDHMWFRGCEPPTFLPAYSAYKHRIKVFRASIDFFLDYHDVFVDVMPPIEQFGLAMNDSVEVGFGRKKVGYSLFAIIE